MSLDNLMENPRFLLLAPTTVEGFVFDDKKWLRLAIRGLRIHKHHSERPMRFDSLDNTVREGLMKDCAKFFGERSATMSMISRFGFGRVGDPGAVRKFGGQMILHFHGILPWTVVYGGS